ncbi:MAG TPA: hypothetical protein VD902_17785 [Symbiobacteriaceae bacterium]|nr:hypothetical protein [Symbiobacteriaceae bacterium]
MLTGGSRTLFLGHFGSGKTEVAIHYALSLCTVPKRPLLLDLDFITPYYRSRDVAEELAARGVDVVAPEGDLTRSDLPVVTARAVQALTNYDGPVVADIGGDEGARVLGSLAGRLQPGRYDAYMVVNPYRPGTGSASQVAAYARWLEQVARIKFTGLVNNANAGLLTQPAHVLEGLNKVQESAELLGLPVVFTSAKADVASLLTGLQVLPLDLKMRPPWELRALEAN